MNLWIPQISINSILNSVWAKIAPTWVAPYVSHRAQAPMALSIFNIFKNRNNPETAHLMANSILGRPLRGAGPGYESRMALIPEPDTTSPLDLTGANSVDFTCRDFCTVQEIGIIFQVAGTVTALVMDFDKFSAPNAAGDVTDKLDGTNGVITAPSIVASQAIGQVVYKDLGNTLNIDLDKGNSVRAIVTTTLTAGDGIPYVLVTARAETNANLSTATVSS